MQSAQKRRRISVPRLAAGATRDLAGGAAGMDHQQIVDHQPAAAVLAEDEVAAARAGAVGHGAAEPALLVDEVRRGQAGKAESELDQAGRRRCPPASARPVR